MCNTTVLFKEVTLLLRKNLHMQLLPKWERYRNIQNHWALYSLAKFNIYHTSYPTPGKNEHNQSPTIHIQQNVWLWMSIISVIPTQIYILLYHIFVLLALHQNNHKNSFNSNKTKKMRLSILCKQTFADERRKKSSPYSLLCSQHWNTAKMLNYAQAPKNICCL